MEFGLIRSIRLCRTRTWKSSCWLAGPQGWMLLPVCPPRITERSCAPWKLAQVGSDLLKKEYNKDTLQCGDEDLLDGIAFRTNGDVNFQVTLPHDRGGCQETYTVTVIGSWSDTAFQFSVDEEWDADDPNDPDCTLNYPCDRQHSISAVPSADPFPAQCE